MKPCKTADSIPAAEPEQHGFCRISKSHADAKFPDGASLLSKQLYGLLIDRSRISEKYGWRDREGRSYVYCTIRQVSEELGCSVRTAGKILTELQTIGLIEKIRQGQGKPNRIYLISPGEQLPGRKE